MSEADDRTRRQLRFSLFLQAFAALMLGVAFVVRYLSSGLDILTALFGILMLVAAAAAVLIGRRLRDF
jgi:drug/metabolite transporter (DMT)-like permease